jgi:hypothetical protein
MEDITGARGLRPGAPVPRFNFFPSADLFSTRVRTLLPANRSSVRRFPVQRFHTTGSFVKANHRGRFPAVRYKYRYSFLGFAKKIVGNIGR